MDPEQEGDVESPEEGVVEEPTKEAVAQPVAQAEQRYVPYNVEAVNGVVDNETNRLFPNFDSQMAELLNKADNIEKSIG